MAKQIKTRLTADTTDFERKMLRAKKATEAVGKTLSIGLVAGAAAAAAGIYAVNRVMSEAVRLANVQEAAETKLAAVLKATGGAAGYNVEQLKSMAGQFQQVTTYGDEVTLSGMAILATFKQIRGEGFERATKAAMDMSAVMGTDLNSSILQIGKALNNPIKGLTMLTRVGVTFTDEQTKQIKTLQQAGDMYGAQAIILKELETQFGGTSAALRGTFAGAVTAAKNAFGDLQEEIGFAITKNEAFIGIAGEAEQKFIEWAGVIKENEEAIAEFAEVALEGITWVVEGLGKAFILVNKWGQALSEAAKRKEIGELYNELYKAEKAVERLVDGFLGFGKGTPEQINKANLEVTALIEKIRELQNEGTGSVSAITEEVEAFVASLGNAGTEVEKVVQKTSNNIIKIKKDVAWETLAIDKELHRDQAKQYKKYLDDKNKENVAAAGEIEDIWLGHHEGIIDAAERAAEIEGELLVELEEKNLSTSNAMGDMWENFSHDVETSFRQTLGGALLGEFETIEDAWEAMWDSMLRSFVGAIAQMVTEWAVSGIAGLFTGKGTSGFSVGGLFGGSSGGGGGGSGALGVVGTGAGLAYEAATGESMTSAFGTYLKSTEAGQAVQAWWTGLGSDGLVGADMLAYEVAGGAGASGAAAGQGIGWAGTAGPGAGQAGVSGGAAAAGGGAAAAGAWVMPLVGAAIAGMFYHKGKSTPTDQLITQHGNVGDEIGTSYFSNVSELFKTTTKTMGELEVRMQSFDQASLDAAEGVMVLKDSAYELDTGMQDASYAMYTFDEATQAWTDQSGTFEDMLGTMQELGPMTDAAVLSTASYLTELEGIPSVTDELVSAYNEVAGTTAVAAGSIEDSTQAYIQSMYGVTISNERAIRVTDALRMVKTGDIEDTQHLSEALKGLGLTQQEVSEATGFLVDMFGPLAADTNVLAGAMANMGNSIQMAYASAGGANNRDDYVAPQVSANVDYRASGGPASGLTWVGEQGPELLNLPPSSHVYSNKDSMTMSSRPIQINNHITLELDGRQIGTVIDTHIVNREERGATGRVRY